MLAREGDKRNIGAQKGTIPVPQTEASAGVSKTGRGCWCTSAVKKGLQIRGALEEETAANVSLEAEPKREWVRQESKRQLLERHSLVF